MTRTDRFITVYRGTLALIGAMFLLLPLWIRTKDQSPQGPAWARHIIDSGYDGSDGTKLADINGDGYPDIATAWETAGITRVYYHPGPAKARERWIAITVGQTPSAEDATFIDLDQDGVMDVVTSMETGQERLAVHWGGTTRGESKDPCVWAQEDLPAARNVTRWMFTQPIQLPGSKYPAIVAGGKSPDGSLRSFVGLFQPESSPRNLDQYTWTPLAPATWVMSIEVFDINGDGYSDIVYSDKKGTHCGVWWIENPGPTRGLPWSIHRITEQELEGCMFLTLADLNQDGLTEVLVGADIRSSPNSLVRRVLILSSPTDSTGNYWESEIVDLPPRTGQPKGVAAGDLNDDGQIDLVLTSTGAEERQVGVYWLERNNDSGPWIPHNISGPEGIKFDLVHLIDIDRDGDLDVLTSEEKENNIGLGVFWYENRTTSRLKTTSSFVQTNPPAFPP